MARTAGGLRPAHPVPEHCALPASIYITTRSPSTNRLLLTTGVLRHKVCFDGNRLVGVLRVVGENMKLEVMRAIHSRMHRKRSGQCCHLSRANCRGTHDGVGGSTAFDGLDRGLLYPKDAVTFIAYLK